MDGKCEGEPVLLREQGRTLTQSLARRQEEGSARLETAPKHEHNEAAVTEHCAHFCDCFTLALQKIHFF